MEEVTFVSKIKDIESSLKQEKTVSKSTKRGKNKTNKAEIEAKVAGQFSTEMGSAAKVKGMSIKTDKKTGKSINTNPNRVEEPKRGRKKGQKAYNKIKDADGKVTAVINQHGVIFSVQEQKALKSAVDSLNRKRKELANREEGLLVGYDINGNLMKSQDAIMTFQASKSVDQFESREAYFNYYNQIKHFTSRGYVKSLSDDMKDRYLKTIRNTTEMTDEEFNEIKKRIEKMSVKEFSMRFGLDIFGTITEYYERSNKTSSERRQYIQNQRTKDMTPKQIEEYLQKQEEWQSSAGGSASNVEDIKRRLGIGEDSIQVDLNENRFTKYREDKKRKLEKEQQRKERKAQETEDKYQAFLKEFGLEDSPSVREKFNFFRS